MKLGQLRKALENLSADMTDDIEVKVITGEVLTPEAQKEVAIGVRRAPTVKHFDPVEVWEGIPAKGGDPLLVLFCTKEKAD